MNQDLFIGLTAVVLVAAVVVLLLPISNNFTGAVTIIDDFNKDELCNRAIDDLVRLNKIKSEVPEINADYDFQKRLNTAILQVQACY